jgi:hypothetical protein
MNTTHEFNLIDGRFTVAEAELLLLDLAQAKVCHHLRRITLPNQSEEDIKATEKRIRAIETDVRAVISQLKKLDPTHRVDISGVVMVQPVD